MILTHRVGSYIFQLSLTFTIAPCIKKSSISTCCSFWPTRPRPVGGHYIHTWCPSVCPKKNTSTRLEQKQATMLHGAWWVTLKSPDLYLFLDTRHRHISQDSKQGERSQLAKSKKENFWGWKNLAASFERVCSCDGKGIIPCDTSVRWAWLFRTWLRTEGLMLIREP